MKSKVFVDTLIGLEAYVSDVILGAARHRVPATPAKCGGYFLPFPLGACSYIVMVIRRSPYCVWQNTSSKTKLFHMTKPKKDTKALTAKQARFVEEYLVDLNATQAAIRAGYSEKTAEQGAAQLLSNIKVSNAVLVAIAERSERTEITQDRVLGELAKIGFSDIRNAVRWGKSPIDKDAKNAGPNGLGLYPVELIPSEDLDDDIAATVSEVSLTQTGIKIKTYDKLSALEKIGKHLGMFVDKGELKLSGEIKNNFIFTPVSADDEPDRD